MNYPYVIYPKMHAAFVPPKISSNLISRKPMIAWIKIVSAAIAAVMMTPSNAQENLPNLSSLYDMRIGATCEELDKSYSKLLENASRRTPTSCFPDTSFAKDEIQIESPGRDERVTLEYTPAGKLWSVWSRVTFKPQMGPAGTITMATVVKRFGRPSMFSDMSQDINAMHNLLTNGHTTLQRDAAWSSMPPPWSGSVNTHVPLASCKSSSKVRAESDCIIQGTKAWASHFAALKGVVTTVRMITDTKNGGRVTSLWTRMYDSKFIEPAKSAYEMQRSDARKQIDLRDIELLPKY